jgi:hypothetical protein
MNRRDFLKSALATAGVVLLGGMIKSERLFAMASSSTDNSLEIWLLGTGKAVVEPEVYSTIARSL